MKYQHIWASVALLTFKDICIKCSRKRENSEGIMLGLVILVWGVWSSTSGRAHGAISTSTMQEIERVNEKGPYLGIVVPNSFEMNPLLQSPSFVADLQVPYLDYFGNCFCSPIL